MMKNKKILFILFILSEFLSCTKEAGLKTRNDSNPVLTNGGLEAFYKDFEILTKQTK
jgi:hypothetical protein